MSLEGAPVAEQAPEREEKQDKEEDPSWRKVLLEVLDEKQSELVRKEEIEQLVLQITRQSDDQKLETLRSMLEVLNIVRNKVNG